MCLSSGNPMQQHQWFMKAGACNAREKEGQKQGRKKKERGGGDAKGIGKPERKMLRTHSLCRWGRCASQDEAQYLI